MFLSSFFKSTYTPEHLLIDKRDVPSAVLPTVGGIGWKQPRGWKNCLSCKGIFPCTAISHGPQKFLMLQSQHRITALFLWHRWQDPGLTSIKIKASMICLLELPQFSETCSILECQLDWVTSSTKLLSSKSSHLWRASCNPEQSKDKELDNSSQTWSEVKKSCYNGSDQESYFH